MLTPYDWQESVGHRIQFIESRLAPALPVAAVSCPEGVLMATYGRHGNKLFEVYDRLALGALGLQSDIEALRTACIEFAHREGFQRAEADVTVQRVATTVSTPIKRAFADFSSAPFIAKAVLVECGPAPEQDRAFVLDFDGDFASCPFPVAIAASEADSVEVVKKLTGFATSLEVAKDALVAAFGSPEGCELECAYVRRGGDADRNFVRI
ncbi:MAG: hypothetical protein IT207_06460 [Fimbriimonadaceae bacterium]|nr:hypothetical protein [Fimbriimonadaceae bacterium]